VVTQKLRDQDRAFANFFAGRARYPRFRKKMGAQSVRYQLDQRTLASRWRAGERLVLAGLGALKLCWSRIPAGAPKMITVSRDAAGRYFVSFMVEEALTPAPATDRAVGVDLGLKDIVVTSDGWRSGAPCYLRRRQRQLKRAKARVARLHARVADQRRDFTHKLSSKLIHENQVIAIEDLDVRALARTKLAKSIGDAGWHELRRQLAYKAEWHGRELVVIDRWTPTTKRCSACGHVREDVALQVRTWSCERCGTEHDRDVNAAINVLSTAGKSAGSEARGGRLNPPVAGANAPATGGGPGSANEPDPVTAARERA